MNSPLPAFTFDHSIATVTWSDLAVELVFDRFHQDRRNHELTAEMTCSTGSNGTRALLHRSRLNLGSTRARKEAAGYLSRRRDDIDWDAILEIAAWKVVDAIRGGRPGVLLRDVDGGPVTDGLVIPPLLLKSDPVILFGDGGSAKSFLGLALAMSIDSGTPHADLPVSQPLRTAYLDFEWQPFPHKRRMQALCADRPMPGLLYVPCGAEGPLSSQVERLLRILHEHSIEYVFLDSVALACAGAPEEAAVALDFFQALTRLQVGSCLLAHVNRSGDEDRPFGSTFWHNSARLTWFLKANQEPGAPRLDLALTNRKSNDGPKAASFALHFEFDALRTTITRTDLAAIPELAGALPLKERIRSLLKTSPQTVADIADRLGANPETVRTTIKRVSKRVSGQIFVEIPGTNPTKWALMAPEASNQTVTRQASLDGLG